MSVVARRYHERAREALRRGDVEAAREDLRAALEMAPAFVAARVGYALLLAREGSAARAADVLREGIAAEQREGRGQRRPAVALHRSLGEVLIAAGDYRGAERAFAAAAELAGTVGAPAAGVADRLARLRAKTGRFAEALEQLVAAARA